MSTIYVGDMFIVRCHFLIAVDPDTNVTRKTTKTFEDPDPTKDYIRSKDGYLISEQVAPVLDS